jgi:hypothetical protein
MFCTARDKANLLRISPNNFKLRQERFSLRLGFKLYLVRATDTLKRELQQDEICRSGEA